MPTIGRTFFVVTTGFALTRPVLADRLPRGVVRDVVLVVGVVAFTALAARISIPVPGSPVPVTGQTLAVLLSAAAVGPLRGLVAGLMYIGVGVVGLPVYAGGSHGYKALVGATGGYFVGFLLATALVGYAARGGYDRRPLGVAVAFLVCSALIYLPGATWLAYYAHLSADAALREGVRPYLFGDVLKAAVAAALLPVAWRIVGPIERSGADARRR
jgi:biotin transport system substrate-specific component